MVLHRQYCWLPISNSSFYIHDYMYMFNTVRIVKHSWKDCNFCIWRSNWRGQIVGCSCDCCLVCVPLSWIDRHWKFICCWTYTNSMGHVYCTHSFKQGFACMQMSCSDRAESNDIESCLEDWMRQTTIAASCVSLTSCSFHFWCEYHLSYKPASLGPARNYVDFFSLTDYIHNPVDYLQLFFAQDSLVLWR